MRLLCVADLHFGAGADLYEPGSTRLRKQRGLWLDIVGEAIRGKAAAIIVAGDVFHRRVPTPEEHYAFWCGLQDADSHDIPVYTIPGNHDVTTMAAADAIQIHDTLHYRTPAVTRIEAADDSVQVGFLPWCPPGRFYAEALEHVDRDDANSALAARLVDVARGLRAEGADILVGHWALGGAVTPTGADVSSFREPVINSVALADIGFPWCVFGHIHKRQWVGGPQQVMYLGSAWAMDWGEWDTLHSVTWLTREGGAWQSEYYTVPDTRLVTVNARDEGLADVEGAVVRVRFHGTRAEYAAWDAAEYEAALMAGGALRVASVSADLVSEARARVEGLTEAAEPGDALQAYIDARGVDEDLAERALAAHALIVEEA